MSCWSLPTSCSLFKRLHADDQDAHGDAGSHEEAEALRARVVTAEATAEGAKAQLATSKCACEKAVRAAKELQGRLLKAEQVQTSPDLILIMSKWVLRYPA